MGRVLNKVHYYDGRIYERVIDPYFAKVRDRISEIVPSGSRVLDVACGTGALCFKLATKGCEVIGIELSLKMVERAKLRQRQEKIENLQFIHGDATRLEKFSILSYLGRANNLFSIDYNLIIKGIIEAKGRFLSSFHFLTHLCFQP